METRFLISAVAFCLCFLTGFTLMKFALNNGKQNVFLPLYLPLAIILPAAYFLFPAPEDFLYNISLAELIAVIAGSGIFFLLASRPRLSRSSFLLLIITAEICYYFSDHRENLFSPDLPLWLDSILSVLAWSLFAWCFRILESVGGILSRQTIAIGTGVFILSLIGAAPFMLAFLGLGLSGVFLAWMIFDSEPAKLRLSPAAGQALGFIIAWLLTKVSAEGAGPCALCFCLFFIWQTGIGFLKKFSLKPEDQYPAANTDFARACAHGLPAHNIASAVSKLLLLLVIFGGFEAFAPNAYSVPLLALLSTVWFSYRLSHWTEIRPERNVKESIEDIRQHFDNLQDNLSQDNRP